MQRESIDLMNIDYDDVLQLYKGWRRSESALKDRNKELNSLKLRTRQLQESHTKFRGQIQALESVKELTIALQSQLSAFEQENKQLEEENKELAQFNLRAEKLINEKSITEERQNQLLNELRIDFATLKGRYEETLKFQKDLENIVNDEKSMRRAAEARISYGEESKDELKEENRKLKQKLEVANMKLVQCDKELSHASTQLSKLSNEMSNMHSADNQIENLKAENIVLRGDIARLIHLIEYFPANKELFTMWQDSEGMAFVGIDELADSHNHSNILRASDQTFLSRDGLGDNSNFVSFTKSTLLTPSEFDQLKRIHGGDPFPLTENISVRFDCFFPFVFTIVAVFTPKISYSQYLSG